MGRGKAIRSTLTKPGQRPGRSSVSRTKTSPGGHVTPLFVKQERATEEKKLLFSMDYGTKTLSVAYRIAESGEEPSLNNIHDVHFGRGDAFAPQAVAWAEDGTFYWGYGIERALKMKQIEQEDVIELWKLLLYKGHESSPMAKLVNEQLGNRSILQLISAHLQAVVKEAKEKIKDAPTFQYSAAEIDELNMQLFLSVPQMWTRRANQIMLEAAKAAGIKHVELVWEPQCAAAYYTHNVKDRLPQQLSVGDVLLIADIGGGTGDFVSYGYGHGSETGATVELGTVGTSEGALCGAALVTENFIAWVKNKAGNFEAKCNKLGLTQTAFIKKASAAFEYLKQSFSVPDAAPEWVTIRGFKDSKTVQWDIEVTCAEIESFFKPVVADIVRCIERQLTSRTRVLIIPGGFGRSEYLLDYLKARYEGMLEILGQANMAVGAYQPVSRGALLRYKDIKARGLTANESFGIGQVEIYDPTIHRDAIMNPAIVENDCNDGEQIVYERWLSIIKRGEVKKVGQPFTTETWQHYMIPVKDTTITVQIYWTEMNVQDHDPILTGANIRDSPVREGIEKWGDLLEKTLPDLEKLGFEPLESEKNGTVYEIYARLMLECEGANISVKWQIALPATQPYDEVGAPRNSAVQLTPDEVFELCDEAYNPFPRTAADWKPIKQEKRKPGDRRLLTE